MIWGSYVGTFFSVLIDPQPGAKYVKTSRSFKKPYINYIRLTAKPGKIYVNVLTSVLLFDQY